MITGSHSLCILFLRLGRGLRVLSDRCCMPSVIHVVSQIIILFKIFPLYLVRMKRRLDCVLVERNILLRVLGSKA